VAYAVTGEELKTAIDRLSAQIEQLAVRAAAAETAVADSNSRRSEEFRRDVQEVRDLLKEFE
jgi:outer membrane murein-binding lipoprotein Lpp